MALSLRAMRGHMDFGFMDMASTAVIRPHQWEHVAFVYDKDAVKMRILLNGQVSMLTESEPRKAYRGDETIYLGSTPPRPQSQSSDQWQGLIHGAMVFNTALSPEAVTAASAVDMPDQLKAK